MNISSTLLFESWLLALDITMMIFLILSILLGSLFLFIIFFDKTCHTICMILVANSFVAQILLASNILSMVIVSLINDIEQIDRQDSFCVFRGYLSYTLTAIMNYSFLLQALYRYIIVVYPTQLFWQTKKIQLLLICLTWVYGFLYPSKFIFTGDIIYNANNQLCQIPLKLSFSLLFMICNAYLIPVTIIQMIYLKLIRYVTKVGTRITTRYTFYRNQRELKMIRQIVIILTILVLLGLPYTLFIFMSFFTDPPKYHFRIAGVFINLSLTFVVIALFQLTDPLKASVLKKMNI